MLLLDATVVSVALPPIGRDLGFTQEGLSWVLNAYVLSSGGFLLLGGRLADVFGRRRMFLIGMVTFGVGSIAAAVAWTPAVLIGARFIQGFGEAFAGPAALGIIAVLFVDPFERIRALTIWGGLAGAGSAAGSLVGGFVTSFASWHWLFIINVPIAAGAFWGVYRLVQHLRPRTAGPVDLWGAVSMTAAAALFMAGILQAVHEPLTAPRVAGPLLASFGFAVAFVFNERRAEHPLIPRGFFDEPVRRASNVLVGFGAAVLASYPFTMTLYAQNVLGYTALDVGFMLLPLVGAIGLGLWLGSRLLRSVSMKWLASSAGVFAGIGLGWTSLLQVDSTYGNLLPGMVLLGLGVGLGIPVLTNGALYATTPANSSLASAIQTASQQAGSALGLALFAAAATAFTMRLTASGTGEAAATVAGFALALRLGAGLSLTSSVLALLVLPRVRASDVSATAGVQGHHHS